MSGDNYVEVTATLVARNKKSVLLKGEEGQAWVGRSCIHGADERTIDDAEIGDEITLRIFEWLASKENLA